MKRFLTTLGLLAVCAASHAAIVNHADVNGVRTFQDTTTGYIWADLDNFLPTYAGPSTPTTPQYADYGSYLAALQAAGFTWADHSAVETMLPPIGSSAEYQAVSGAMNTDWSNLIEGLAGYSSWAGGYHVHELQFTSTGIHWGDWTTTTGPATSIVQGQGRGLWAYMPAEPELGNPVPEPTSMALALLGLTAVARSRRRLVV